MVQLLEFVDKEFDERNVYANKSKCGCMSTGRRS